MAEAQALLDEATNDQLTDQLYDYLRQTTPEVLDQSQLALAEITHHLGGEFHDLTDLEAVFIDGQAIQEPRNPIFHQLERTIEDYIKSQNGSLDQDASLSLEVLSLRLAHHLNFTDTLEDIRRAYGELVDPHHLFTHQARGLTLVADQLQSPKTPKANGSRHLGKAATASLSLVSYNPNPEPADASHHPANLKNLSSHAIEVSLFSDPKQLSSETDQAIAFIQDGTPPQTSLSLRALKGALRKLAGSKILDGQGAEDVLGRFQEVNECLAGLQPGDSLMRPRGFVELPLLAPPSWANQSRCLQAEPDTFFPEKGGSTREAKRICGDCKVTEQCLEYALENDERFGIWGGLSERERRRLNRRAAS